MVMAFFLLLVIIFVHLMSESLRFLYDQEKYEELDESLLKIYEKNA